MSIDLMALVWRDDYYTQADKAKLLVALALADNANADGFAFPSVDFIAKKARTSIRGVQEVCRQLAVDGKIEIREGKGRNGTNLYRITPPQRLHPTPATAAPQGKKHREPPRNGCTPATVAGCNGAAEEAALKPAEEAAAGCTQIIRNHQEASGTAQEPPPTDPPGAAASPPLGDGEKASPLPVSEEAKALSILFHRRLTTEWSKNEIKAFKAGRKCGAITLEAIALLVPYYESERAKGGDGIHRRDLQTALNNFQGEVDRAQAFSENPMAHSRTGLKPMATEAQRDQRNTGLAPQKFNLKIL